MLKISQLCVIIVPTGRKKKNETETVCKEFEEIIG
jgi:hypothetical protein